MYVVGGIFKLRYGLVILIIATISFIIINPSYIFKSNSKLKASYQKIYEADTYCYLEDNPVWNLITATSSNNNKISFHMFNSGTMNLSQSELIGYQGVSKINGNFLEFYDDQETNCIYTIAIRNKKFYDIIKFDKNNIHLQLQTKELYRYDLYDSLFSQNAIWISDRKYSLEVSNNNENIKINKINLDHFKIIVSKEKFKQIITAFAKEDIDTSPLIKQEIAFINTIVPDKITNKDFYKLVTLFRRNNYYQHNFKTSYPNRENTFMDAYILGKIDANNDGNKEFLIVFLGHRFINTKLICYDYLNGSVLWDRDFTPDIKKNIEIVDIDDDGKDEIILPFYAPKYEKSVDIYENDFIGSVNKSKLIILDNQGCIKKINNANAAYNYSNGFCTPNFLFIPEKKEILFGLKTTFDNSEKFLKIWDLTENRIKESNLQYQNITSINRDNGKIELFDISNGQLSRRTLDLNYQVLKEKSANLDDSILSFSYQSIELYGKKYHTIPSRYILDDNLNIVYNFKNNTRSNTMRSYNNVIYFIEDFHEQFKLCMLHFYPNHKLNPYFVITILVEIILMLLFFIFYQRFTIPTIKPNYSYFICNSIAGRLHFWRIEGQLKSHYHLPRKISNIARHPKEVLKELSPNSRLISEKNFIIFKQRVFEISNLNEFLIMQRISHDLKNRLNLLTLQIHDMESKIIEKNNMKEGFKQLHQTIKEITLTSRNLTNLSKIDKVVYKRFKIKELFNEINELFFSHPLFECLNIQAIDEDLIINGDKNLLKMGLTNLIKNAFDEICLTDKIIIDTYRNIKGDISIKISNPIKHEIHDINKVFEPGFTSKQTGTGTGIPITQMIILKHNGEFNILKYNNSFICIITLPDNLKET